MTNIIMIPGLGSDAAVWQPTIDALGPEFFCRVGDTHSDDSLPAMARRILADAPEEFALAGCSMGGMVALEIMRIAAHRVKCLALLDTSARPDTAEQIERRRQTNAAMARADDIAPLVRQALAFMVHPDANDNVRGSIVAMIVRVGAATYIQQNEAVIGREDLRSSLSAISVPTLIAVGANDMIFPPELSEELSVGIPGAVLHVIPGCGHLPPIEAPQVVAGLLQQLLMAEEKR